MINIISRSVEKPVVTGPSKVVTNLIRGLDLIGYPYVLNRDISATQRLWIHDDPSVLEYAYKSSARTVVGPNLYVMPHDIPSHIRLEGMLYLLPGPTSERYWRELGFSRCELTNWPAGIDTREFSPPFQPKVRDKVLLYHKHRDRGELQSIQEVLKQSGFEYRLFEYGEYAPSEYIDALATTLFVLWHGGNESQGIALLEALACNVPILVCDIRTLREERSGWDFGPIVGSFAGTAAPFFDERCGLRLTDLRTLPVALRQMREGLSRYEPREYVLENFTLEGQAREFVRLWERWGLSEASGLQERLRNDKYLRPPWSQRLRRLSRRGASRLRRLFDQ